MSACRPVIEASFIDSARGALFSLHRPPATTALSGSGCCFVLAPSFAEEMNRCRYMCNLFATAVTAQGHGFLSVDPYGTGDSAGDFAETDWQQWQDDLVFACDHARALGYERIALFGIRVGALLAMEILPRVRPVERVLLWQPVISGRNALTQFLRIRIAASLEREEDGGTVAGFIEQIDAGQLVEVAGYDVSPGLCKGLMEADLSQHLDLTDVPIVWLNTLASAERKTPRPELNCMDAWRERGARIRFETVIGPPYWSAHERTLAPALVSTTMKVLEEEQGS